MPGSATTPARNQMKSPHINRQCHFWDHHHGSHQHDVSFKPAPFSHGPAHSMISRACSDSAATPGQAQHAGEFRRRYVTMLLKNFAIREAIGGASTSGCSCPSTPPPLKKTHHDDHHWLLNAGPSRMWGDENLEANRPVYMLDDCKLLKETRSRCVQAHQAAKFCGDHERATKLAMRHEVTELWHLTVAMRKFRSEIAAKMPNHEYLFTLDGYIKENREMVCTALGIDSVRDPSMWDFLAYMQREGS